MNDRQYRVVIPLHYKCDGLLDAIQQRLVADGYDVTMIEYHHLATQPKIDGKRSLIDDALMKRAIWNVIASRTPDDEIQADFIAIVTSPEWLANVASRTKTYKRRGWLESIGMVQPQAIAPESPEIANIDDEREGTDRSHE